MFQLIGAAQRRWTMSSRQACLPKNDRARSPAYVGIQRRQARNYGLRLSACRFAGISACSNSPSYAFIATAFSHTSVTILPLPERLGSANRRRRAQGPVGKPIWREAHSRSGETNERGLHGRRLVIDSWTSGRSESYGLAMRRVEICPPPCFHPVDQRPAGLRRLLPDQALQSSERRPVMCLLGVRFSAIAGAAANFGAERLRPFRRWRTSRLGLGHWQCRAPRHATALRTPSSRAPGRAAAARPQARSR